MFIVYTKPNCTYCDQAKKLLEMKGLPFKTVMLDHGQEKEEGKEYISRDDLLALFPGAKMMPQISKDGISVNGYQGLVAMLSKT